MVLAAKHSQYSFRHFDFYMFGFFRSASQRVASQPIKKYKTGKPMMATLKGEAYLAMTAHKRVRLRDLGMDYGTGLVRKLFKADWFVPV